MGEGATLREANQWPSVGVVIPTCGRQEGLRGALESIAQQDYEGSIHVVVVFDGGDPAQVISASKGQPIEVVLNSRMPGAAGARNTGILALGDVELVAFCDDDDCWMPGKLKAQVLALADDSDSQVATTGIELICDGKILRRTAKEERIFYRDLLRSRMAMLHTSTFLVRYCALVDDGKVGLFAEDAPGSNNEDFDFLLRAARCHPIRNVNRALCRVAWGRGSFFSHQYQTKINSMMWLLRRHPELLVDDRGAAHRFGQLACWHAALRQRRRAIRWALRSLRRSWREPRAGIALAASAGLMSIDAVIDAARKRGRGI